MAFVKDEMKETLKEVNEYSLVIRYLIDEKIISFYQFASILIKSNLDERVLMFKKVLSVIKVEYYEEAIKKYGQLFTKRNCFLRLYLNEELAKETLQEADDNIDSIVSNLIYYKILKEISTKYLLELFTEYKKGTLEDSVINNYKILLAEITSENNDLLRKKINEYFLVNIKVKQ